jgi:2'-5' RNA ligase
MRTEPNARLYLALWPGKATRAALARCRNGWRWDERARPEPTERLHLTVLFLGAVPRRRLPEVGEGLGVGAAPFTLRLDQWQQWSGGLAVLLPTLVPPALLALHSALLERSRGLGLQPDPRPLRPHVTLARHGRSSVAPSDPPRLVWPVRGYALVESRLSTREQVVLRRFGFNARRASGAS